MIQGVNTIIDGVQMIKGTGVVQGQSLTQAAPFAKVGGAAAPVQMGAYIDGVLTYYHCAVVRVSSATACHLSGAAAPAGEAVCLAKVDTTTPSLADLRSGQYDQIMTDDIGTWQADAPDGYDGLIAAWISVVMTGAADVQAYGVTIVADQEEPDIPSGHSLRCQHTVDVPESGEGWTVTYDYTCPDDVRKIDMYVATPITCPDCSGSGTSNQTCPECNGSGSRLVDHTCSACGGSGTVMEQQPCPDCGGTGMIGDESCPTCAGFGYTESSQMCPTCGGTGTEQTEEPCSYCGGIGTVAGQCPACGGSGMAAELSQLSSDVINASSGTIAVSIQTGLTAGLADLLWQCISAKDGALTTSNIICKAICLSGDTRITLADGTSRRMDELTGDELVLGGDMLPARILRLASGTYSPRHTLYHFEDGTTIDETHEHRFFNSDQGFWQKLKGWHIGDRARRLDGSTPALVSVEPVEERAEMFGLWVERGSYWANGLLSGDASANQALLADATAEQAADMAISLAERDLMRMLGLEGLLP